MKAILVFDYNIYKQLKRFNTETELNLKIVYVNNFNYYRYEFEDNKLKNYTIEPKISKASYILKNLGNIDEIYAIINNNEYYHFLTYSIKKLLLHNPIILGINLLKVNKENLLESINNAYPLNKNIYNLILLKTIVKGISKKYIAYHIKEILETYIPLSYNELGFLQYLYNNMEKENKTYFFKEKLTFEKIDEIDINNYSNTLNIIKNVQKLFPTISENKIIEKILNFYYGIENKDYKNFIGHEFTEDTINRFIKLLKNSNEMYFKLNPIIDYNQYFITEFNNEFNSFLEKNVYITIFILNLLKIANLEFIKEKLLYKTKRGEEKVFKFYSPYITKEFIETLKKYKIEIYNIETIINNIPKTKFIHTKKNHIAKINILDNRIFETYDINIKYYNWFILKLEEAKLIKIKNKNIEITSKAIYLLENLNLKVDEKLLNKINNFYEKLKGKKLSKQKIIEYTNMLFDKYFTGMIQNSPTLKQKNLINKIIKENNLENININTKQEAQEFIEKYIKPTSKQIKYALEIANKLGIELDKECLQKKYCIENFINKNKGKLYAKPTPKMINLAKELAQKYSIPLDKDILNDFYKTRDFINKII